MAKTETEKQGCGCASIPIFPLLLLLAGGWFAVQQGYASLLIDRAGGQQLLAQAQTLMGKVTGAEADLPPMPAPVPAAVMEPVFTPPPMAEPPPVAVVVASRAPVPEATPAPPMADVPSAIAAAPASNPKTSKPPTPWEQKQIRGIYLSRYQATNNASEQVIRDRVRYYKSKGFNTIIHGVWGNGCTMYKSKVMLQTLGFESCPNLFREPWLDWMIDEAQKQDMEVHAYFEKGIKIDKNSPIYDLAVSQKWLVPGVDKTYSKVDHYVLDMDIPEVATFFKDIVAEFVQRYPEIDAVQWDDYLGYHAELPGQVDRTAHLTKFVQEMATQMKRANPNVSFDLCHHNPYWAKRYFAADWENWPVDRVFIQVYNDANFEAELGYVRAFDGVAIADNQLDRLKQLAEDEQVDSILIFPNGGQPEQAAAQVQAKLVNDSMSAF
ncbi:MAG: family 10 glycosylhydrolase [Synechococcales cyanobacterium RM1_1_8]|nr:family 10 glycosylhydrolase [Synechococcales cyanobacterium RM1_1_8]